MEFIKLAKIALSPDKLTSNSNELADKKVGNFLKSFYLFEKVQHFLIL